MVAQSCHNKEREIWIALQPRLKLRNVKLSKHLQFLLCKCLIA
nr:unnamed protein product [Callosobruchus chinensis]